jgi:flagellar capping protein FliD
VKYIHTPIASGASVAVNVNVTQGFADRFYNLATSYIDTTQGQLTSQKAELSANKTRNLEQVTLIDTRIAKYREQLVQQYAALEGALTQANNILAMLNAQANARNNNG